MEDTHSKYIKLFNSLVITFLAFVIGLALLLLALRFAFGLLNQLSWFVYFYLGFIVLVPAMVFITVFIIYLKRSLRYPTKSIRYFSVFVCGALLLTWGFYMVKDIYLFFTKTYIEIGKYHCYQVWFLSLSVVAIFGLGVVQALGTEKEKDWMARNREQNEPK